MSIYITHIKYAVEAQSSDSTKQRTIAKNSANLLKIVYDFHLYVHANGLLYKCSSADMREGTRDNLASLVLCLCAERAS